MSGGGVCGRARSAAVIGLDAVSVAVEAHVGQGLPAFTVIGAAGAAGRQAADRVRTALAGVGVQLGVRKVLVSLAPAEVPKAGARFDLAIAVAVLVALGEIAEDAIGEVALLGELGLDGSVRPVPGVLPAAATLPSLEVRRLLVADANAAEAALVDGLTVTPVADLAEVLRVLRGNQDGRQASVAPAGTAGSSPPDLADVRGQAAARRALEIAAAGGHHVLLLGAPGCGKSMLARRLPGLLPSLRRCEALELAAVRSVAGLLTGREHVLDQAPPFRAPHHTISAAALLGGGSGVARPGEVSLSHRGVLFLDELFEWSRRTLEALREPLEEGLVRIARARASVSYPAGFQLVCAANPCPCGGRACHCTDEAIAAYRGKLSGPLADRLDLAPTMTPLRAEDLLGADQAEPTRVVAARVTAARDAGLWRGVEGTNAATPPAVLRRLTRSSALRQLAAAVEAGELTGRGYDRTLRVARTCADLAGSELTEPEHVAEAHAHRLALATASTPVR